ncbi:MAG TPA: hypothetical protein VGV86_15635 [Acidimicrobiales bacterium]|nr:hypothetical protein [Acidimicrobiales bacterium]
MHLTTAEGVVDRMKGVSHIAVLRPPVQAEVLARVRAIPGHVRGMLGVGL